MEKVLKKFEVKYLQVLDKDGKCDEKLLPKLQNDEMRRLYEMMVQARVFDEVCLKLQREGRMGTYASLRGQEAVNAGIAYAMRPEDWYFPMYRDSTGAMVFKGLQMERVVLYWKGDERGMAIPKDVNMFPLAIPVATQIPHAVGFAWAAKIKREKYACLVTFGDGGTSKADFHEAANFAGVLKVPCVFVCENNQWAISVPRERQSAAETLAQKAIAYGFEGIQVDGNDVFAVYRACREALDKARSGGGPTLIECYTYRLEHHTTADDWRRYRSEEEVKGWEKKDPILRLRLYLKSKKLWDASYEKNVLEEARKKVESAVKRSEELPPPEPGDMFKYVYEKPTPEMLEQMREVEDGQA